MTGEYGPTVGDLADAEYVVNGYGTIARLRGVGGGVGEFNGQRTTSVYGTGESTKSSTTPIPSSPMLTRGKHGIRVAPPVARELGRAMAEFLTGEVTAA